MCRIYFLTYNYHEYNSATVYCDGDRFTNLRIIIKLVKMCDYLLI